MNQRATRSLITLLTATALAGVTAAKLLAKKVVPGGLVLCAAGAGWAYFRSDAREWVRVGDAVTGCF